MSIGAPSASTGPTASGGDTSGAGDGWDRSALMSTYRQPPVTFVSGYGSTLTDSSGMDYLDFIGGLAVTSLGHCHPEVTEAVSAQARLLWHVSNLFGNTVGPQVAVAIDRLIGDGERAGGQVFFSNSGAEANECAIKLARRWGGEGRHTVITTHDSFHGRTLATLTATGQPAKHAPFLPLPEGFGHVPYDDLDAMEKAIAGETVIAVMVEPILGESGVITPSPDYLLGIRRLCDERGVLLVADEIQTGLARTGRWFAFQHCDVEPDIVTMAKALGNGMPIGACWARSEVAAAFGPGDHGSTFGGQPLAASAAKATIEVMERIDAPALAARAGAYLRRGLAALPGVVSVRGAGLLLGAQLEEPIAEEVTAECLKAGLVINAPRTDTLRMAPPLTVSEDEIDRALVILGEVLAQVRGSAVISDAQRAEDLTS